MDPDFEFEDEARQTKRLLIVDSAHEAALYLRSLKDQGVGDYEALELTRHWMSEAYATPDPFGD